MPFSLSINDFLFRGLAFFLQTWFLWLPLVLGFLFWQLWVHYVRARYIYGLQWTTLEIKLPREIYKTPRATEVFLNSLHITKDGNALEKYWQGFLRLWFSLEIVGINGQIRFFIYTQKFFRNLVESQVYAQYPDVEIVEVEDYSKEAFVDGFGKEWGCFGTEFALTADDAYPIKTYIDYGLHETATKEEQKVDPLTALLELIGSLKEGEQIWFQILIRATKKDWKEEGKKVIEKIIGLKPGATPEDRMKAVGALHAGQVEAIKATERAISKLGFDVCIRELYLARNEVFNHVNIPAMIGIMKQFNSPNLNGFKPANPTSVDYFFKKSREAKLKRRMLNAYRKRSAFYMPYPRKTFVLNTEELATIYHFPGRVAETPTFGRIEAKKSEAPANLPV